MYTAILFNSNTAKLLMGMYKDETKKKNKV